MKKRILSILLTLCMVLCLVPTAAFAEADSDTMPKTLSGAIRPAATQYTYTLHYDANGGSGAPPSQSVKSTEFYVWVPISEKIPTRDGYTFMGWANTRTGKPLYGGNGGYTECLVVHGSDMSTTIYAIWEVHNHSWGEWISNGNGTHKRTCNTDSSHTETGSCSGGKATGTEKAICETCHTAYGELLQLTKTVITTPPALPAEGYVGNEYIDEALQGGEAKAEGTGDVVPGSFRFKHNGGGRVVRPGENRMEVLFTPNDTEAYTTAECIVTVTGIKRTITRVPEDVVITDKPLFTGIYRRNHPMISRPVKFPVEPNFRSGTRPFRPSPEIIVKINLPFTRIFPDWDSSHTFIRKISNYLIHPIPPSQHPLLLMDSVTEVQPLINAKKPLLFAIKKAAPIQKLLSPAFLLFKMAAVCDNTQCVFQCGYFFFRKAFQNFFVYFINDFRNRLLQLLPLFCRHNANLSSVLPIDDTVNQPFFLHTIQHTGNRRGFQTENLRNLLRRCKFSLPQTA